MKLRVAFQGGGAKLASMIAVADGIYDSCKQLNVKLEKVAGASAGAIAAAILATGRPPRDFAARLREIGPDYEKRIFRTRSMPHALALAAFGMPILDRAVYSNFLTDLFTINGTAYSSLADLAIPIDVVSTDLIGRKRHVYANTADVSLIDCLLDSSAIPFFLHTFRDRNDRVDGGLINNLPIQSLLDETVGEEQGHRDRAYTIAVTFFDETTRQKSTNLIEYVLSIVSTVIDYNVEGSISLDDKVRIHKVYTTTGLLDFKAALDNDLSKTNFEQQRDRIMDLVADLRREDALRYSSLPNTEFAARLEHLYDAISEGNAPTAQNVIYRWTCLGLKTGSPAERDICQVQFDLTIEEGICWSHALRYTAAEAFNDIGNVKVQVTDAKGRNVGCTTFPLTPDLLKDIKQDYNLFLFFHRPLVAGDRYTVRYQFLASEVLYDLSTTGEDVISFYARGSRRCDDVHLIAFVPEELGEVQLASLREVDGDDPKVIVGEALTDHELDFLGLPPMGYKALGWWATGIEITFGTGFVARTSLSSRFKR